MNNTFVIVTWNNINEICILLDSIKKYEFDSKIVIVDNASTDGTVSCVKSNYDDVLIKSLSVNVGFAKANNYGLKFVDTKYITLINPDTELVQKFSNVAIRDISQDDVKLVAGRLINSDGTLQPSIYKFQNRSSILVEQFQLGKFFPNKLKEKISPENSKHEEKMIVDWLIGAFLFTEVRTLQSVGGFSEDYFLYAEDMDLSYKYHERNYKVMFDPSFSIKHLGGTSERQDISEDKSSKLIRAFITFANKYKLSQNITAFKFSYTVKLIVIFPISFLSGKGKVIFNRYKNNLKILNESRNIN